MGVAMGNFVAQHLVDEVGEAANPWPTWFKVVEKADSLLPPELARHIDDTIAKAWKRMGQERRSFLELLSRLDLTQDQASTLVTPEGREGTGSTCRTVTLRPIHI